ncbi:putative toxin-antitoxin system toxin component, PIN family [Leptospira sp. GIMC2001]|uniref:putative toxin-antitoxin system toxin component, PIN family n=1 Tax=Leptospira sp. GIMC2001 TaxID=1513297 RepID=UPI00234A68E9|nr:putative toxin-antitoxin system toxin component, PIN family [Leptospira sp. GIMC2001]WCL51325.1 putative toxin-antitoxin system toxin component, PIN family [Leptospira sp. GIMC2001]
MLRILLDTNIYISAIVFKGKPRKILQDLIEKKYIGLITKEILEEIEGTLSGKKFSLKSDYIHAVIEEIKEISEIIKNKPLNNYFELRDRDDFHILEACFSGKIDYLITGDKDLLELNINLGFRIISPGEYDIVEKLFEL